MIKREKKETKLYGNCILHVGLYVNHIHILISLKPLSFNMDYIHGLY